MKTNLITALGAAIAIASAAQAQTALNAAFDYDTIGRTPRRDLYGLPIGDEFGYLGTGDYVKVVPWRSGSHSRAAEIRTMAGARYGIVELVSAQLPPGGRTRLYASTMGQLASPIKYGSLALTISLDSSVAVTVVELSDGQVYLHELAADGTTLARRRFATYRTDLFHQLSFDFDVKTTKCVVKFREGFGAVATSPAVLCPSLPSLGNARHVSMVYNYSERSPVYGAYAVAEARAWVNFP